MIRCYSNVASPEGASASGLELNASQISRPKGDGFTAWASDGTRQEKCRRHRRHRRQPRKPAIQCIRSHLLAGLGADGTAGFEPQSHMRATRRVLNRYGERDLQLDCAIARPPRGLHHPRLLVASINEFRPLNENVPLVRSDVRVRRRISRRTDERGVWTAGHDAGLSPRETIRAQPEVCGMGVDKAGVPMPSGEGETYLGELVGKIRVVADAVAGLISRAGCEAVEERNSIQPHREAIGKRVGGAGRRLHTGGFRLEIGDAHACWERVRITVFGGVVPGAELCPSAGDQGSSHIPAVIEDIDRFLQLDRFRAELDDLAGSTAAAFALRGWNIALPRVNGLVCGPVPLDAAPRRLVVEPPDISKV
jgi:hypothetical protein